MKNVPVFLMLAYSFLCAKVDIRHSSTQFMRIFCDMYKNEFGCPRSIDRYRNYFNHAVSDKHLIKFHHMWFSHFQNTFIQ